MRRSRRPGTSSTPPGATETSRPSGSSRTSWSRPAATETRGLYIGCGNGRNLIPLLDAGLDLLGLDISTQAITQLRQQRPDRAGQLIVGDLSAVPGAAARYELVIGIQVFQHGTRQQAHQHLVDAAARVGPGGLFCVRVNSTDSDINHSHHRFEDNDAGSFTLRYLTGPKTGLNIHFFTADELREVIGTSFTEELPPHTHSTPRNPPGHGQWSQWKRSGNDHQTPADQRAGARRAKWAGGS